MSDYSKLKIEFVKFYQAVVIQNKSNQISCKVVSTATVNEPVLFAIEKTADGVMIIATERDGNKSHSEVPYNNIAYIKYVYEMAPSPSVKPIASKTK